MLDLNLDAGEDLAALQSGKEARLYSLVTRINVACGGHAGDETSMRTAAMLAKTAGVLVGAHPSYPDREGFGRAHIPLSSTELVNQIISQVSSLKAICDSIGVTLDHVKPHGALYNELAHNLELARAVSEGVKRVDPGLKLVALAGSLALDLWRSQGLQTLAEAFLDRRYQENGTLVPRSQPHALISDPTEMIAQLRVLLERGLAQTYGVHGDTPWAESLLRSIPVEFGHTRN